jgi:uncharacterized damage-inducible protein DinB
MQKHFSMFAFYNRWANERLYAAAGALSDEDYRANHGAFFSSLHGTLNHILVGDRIWMRRFTGNGLAPTRLDEILFDDLPGLAAARQAEDARIVAYAEALSEADLAAAFSYRTISNPTDVTQPLALALAHFFNHQTHHRGQAHCLLTIIGGHDAAPSLDLIIFQRQMRVGMG